MPSSPQNISVDLVELSSDDEDSGQGKRSPYQIPCEEKLPVKEENSWSLSNCRVKPTEYIISSQSPPITAPDLRGGLHEDMARNSDYIWQQLPLAAFQEVRTNLTRVTIGSGTSNPGHDSFSGHAQQNHFRSFWKAGDYNYFSNLETSSTKGKMECVRVHPKFLHSNATSHKWAFGAIAELLDNAVDEIRNGATFVKVDKIYNKRDNSPALLFHDNGGGMDPECIRQCMSLGYSSKKNNTTIGQYGNGFKTSTMRLGADTIVFSRTSYRGILTESIGLLSYTFLRKTGQDDVVVPLVDFEVSNGHARPMIHGSLGDWKSNMKILLQWSPFSSEEELMQNFEDIGAQGTKILIFNMWLNDDGLLELDFDDDKEDIRLRGTSLAEAPLRSHTERLRSHISYMIRHSLREYASILYLRRFENFQIILRGRPVEQHIITDDLQFPEVITYKPQLGFRAKEVSVAITIGFDKEALVVGINGFNVYNRNRLIMPFWRVIHANSSCGSGVVGCLEVDFMEPAHDKQDFERTTIFIRLESRLKQLASDYWRHRCHLAGYKNPIHNFSVENRHGKTPSVQSVVGLAASGATKSSEPNLYSHNVFQTEKDSHLHQRQAERMAATALSSLIDASAGIQNVVTSGRTAEGGQDLAEAVPLLDWTDAGSVDRICEQNVQLFMRCEQHRQRETELKQKIERLEKDLVEARRKYSLLLSDLEAEGQ